MTNYIAAYRHLVERIQSCAFYVAWMTMNDEKEDICSGGMSQKNSHPNVVGDKGTTMRKCKGQLWSRPYNKLKHNRQTWDECGQLLLNGVEWSWGLYCTVLYLACRCNRRDKTSETRKYRFLLTLFRPVLPG